MKHLEFGFGGLLKLSEITGKQPDEIFESYGKNSTLALIRDLYIAGRYNENHELTAEEAVKEIDEAIKEIGFIDVMKNIREAMKNSILFKKKGENEEKGEEEKGENEEKKQKK